MKGKRWAAKQNFEHHFNIVPIQTRFHLKNIVRKRDFRPRNLCKKTPRFVYVIHRKKKKKKETDRVILAIYC